MATDRPKDNPVDREGTDLVNRLAQLSPVHPSGVRYFGDRKPADLAKPLSDAEYAKHAAEVREALSDARKNHRGTEYLFTIDARRTVWMSERAALHQEILEEMYSAADQVPCAGEAILAGGLPGAGKTTVLTKWADVDTSRFLVLNPDEIKENMARRGVVPVIQKLSPMEATDLVHEESSHITKQLALLAYAHRRNVIWDITMSSSNTTQWRISELRNAGYDAIGGIFVDIPVEVSVGRTETRHRIGHEQFLARNGLGGRCIPTQLIWAQADEQFGSRNRAVFETVKPQFDWWRHYDNSIDGRSAQLIDSGKRPGYGKDLE